MTETQSTNGNLTRDLVKPFIQAGAWAVLALILLYYSGQRWNSETAAWEPIRQYAVEYIQTSSKNNAAIVDAMQTQADVAAQIHSCLEERRLEHVSQTQQLTQLIQMMQLAYERMRDVPEIRQKEFDTLQRIERAIEELRDAVNQSGADLPTDSAPNP